MGNSKHVSSAMLGDKQHSPFINITALDKIGTFFFFLQMKIEAQGQY